MLKRFQDSRILLEALHCQPFVAADAKFATELAKIGKLENWAPGDVIIKQGASDRDLFFILLGQFSVFVNNREMAQRIAGQHVGEMALLDHQALRSATVIAREPSVTFRVSESDFTNLAREAPSVWRYFAIELGNRLRQRRQYVRNRNSTPIVFVGSSTETLPIVRAIQAELSHDPFIVRAWTTGVFGASSFPIDDLQVQLDESDFAVLVIGPDDKVSSRGSKFLAPRDNVIFELGLFMGAFGRHRTFIVQERGRDIKIPSDLLGLGTIRFDSGAIKSLKARIVQACDAIREKVRQMGAR
ncbi:MAG TPA: TIR domain-containing protein [Candidatus Acidoferrum sp.]|nr:TIR domain-containing protein [Candidatus Acidoferrum sp.]